jgi:predicted transglutaminase-like cysteine proteinase
MILSAILVVMLIVTASLAGALALEMSENSRLKEDFEGSSENEKNLNNQIDNLERDKESLENDIDDLEDDIDDLEDDIDDLESQISTLKNQKQSLQNEIDEWQYIYDMRTGVYPYDLVTPNDPSIVSKSRQILGADADGDLTWNDMYKINDWVHSNIQYSYDPYITHQNNYGQWDYWQTAKETLDRGEGDCDDLANLALSLMLAEKNVGWLYAARVTFADGSGHVGIFVNVVSDTMFILDPTWGWRTSTNKAEPQALDDWADSQGLITVTMVREVYSDSTSNEFWTLQEFYDWF